MGLALALNSARTSLAATSTQIAVTARNTAGASDPFYTRKIANLVAAGGGSAVSIQRATDTALFDRKLAGTSSVAASEAVLDGLTTLQNTLGDTADGTSPAARLGALTAALKIAANQPDDAALARSAVDRARDLAASLNAGADAVQTVRAQADAGLADSVTRINDLLSQFEAANRIVTSGTGAGTDVTDALDDRDRILAGLSEEIGISTVVRAGNDIAIYTDSGVPLFERGARKVSFSPTAAFASGTTGAAVMVDGVPVTGAASPMPVHSGRIAGLAELRDNLAIRYESQLDAIADGLVDAFTETGLYASGQGGSVVAAGTALTGTSVFRPLAAPGTAGTADFSGTNQAAFTLTLADGSTANIVIDKAAMAARAADPAKVTPAEFLAAINAQMSADTATTPLAGKVTAFLDVSGRLAFATDATSGAAARLTVGNLAATPGATPVNIGFSTASGLPPRAAGLFTASDVSSAGLAARIRVNGSVDPQQGGDVTLLRDGGIAGTGYQSNPASFAGAGFPDRLRALSTALAADRAFDPSSDLASNGTLQDFASASTGWLSAKRQAATSESNYQSTLLARASTAYSNATGVNMDDETATTLELERSYTASAKLLTVINDLLKTLMDAVR
ncbi:flagellar hook-associated protein FlgK [Methylobacterium flocculans]|uniref:flagellar hook-associated protein FlgK n=1 Tax=Methylobacterium flocculans TaxID=2984843 RepID=UPI0021F2F190|nr:flagellar hook-associated protein FlgK [Methylobacterium sp. FF17]